MTTFPKLFSPIKIGSMEVKNRIVMCPINGPGWHADDGTVSDRLIGFHASQAKGGVGLIVIAGVMVDPVATYSMFTVPIWHDKFIPGFARLAKAVHAHGAKLAPQVMHLGPIRNPDLCGVPSMAASAIAPKESHLHHVPKEMTLEEIAEVVEAFGESARRAREAGCDAIEIHACHGIHHMVSTFMSPRSNKRTDAYGGSARGRIQFAVDVIKSIKAHAGQDFPVLMRISADEIVPGGRTILESQLIAPLLVEAGVDALHIAGGSQPEASWWVLPPAGTPLGLNVPAAAAIKEVVNVPVIAAGRIKDPLLAEHILGAGKADLVAMGRALMADPELPNKARAGQLDDIAPCISCNSCIASIPRGRMTCLINPTLCREQEMAIIPAERRKNVMVVGGGVGGLEAAWVAALRGHSVSLFEKEARLGGQFALSAVPPLKQENTMTVKYLASQAAKAGVAIELGHEVTPATVAAIKPDVLVVATGAGPRIPEDLPGVLNPNVVAAHDVLAGKTVVTAANVLVLGGNMVGCEVADFLAEPGDLATVRSPAVTIVEMRPDLCADMSAEPRYMLLQSLRRKRVNWITSARVKAILPDGVTVSKNGNEESLHGFDLIILALGASSVDRLSEAARHSVPEVYVIGDAKEPRTAVFAIEEASEIARRL